AAKAWASHYPNLVKVLINLWVYYPYKVLNKGHKTAGCAPSSLSLACYFVPFITALCFARVAIEFRKLG
ncbi:hypothetical protein, partial [Pseudoalteromonas sp. NSLLW218]|uniref:hypothetical protein n=1 Tax=Pseudoalteromonas sp. NSLLW218 TaxID=2792048 RepID=UPI001E463B32